MKANFGKKSIVFTILLLAVVFVYPARLKAFSADCNKPMPGGGEAMHRPPMSPCRLWRNPRIVKDLELTAEQVSKFKEADFAYRENSLKLKAALDQLDLAMEKAFSTEPVDEAAVADCAKKIADLRGKLFFLNIESRLACDRLLTAEQRKKLRAGFQPFFAGRGGEPHQRQQPGNEESGGN